MKRTTAALMVVANGLGFGWSPSVLAQGAGVHADRADAGTPPDDPSTSAPVAAADSGQNLPLYPAAIPVNTPTTEAPTPVATASGQPERAIEEIVVTARRTAESIQSVPVAISAMSADDLQRESINSGQDLAGRVPSLSITSGGLQRNVESPSIRGQGATATASPGVVIYFAEVPLPADSFGNNQGGPGKFFDLQNLQVLKGPQGTLFGRNTTGGALLLEPHKPEETFSASLRAEGTSYSGQGYEGVLNIPLISDTLLMRVAGKYFQRDGFTTDVVTGKEYDNKHFWTGRFGLTWRPTDEIDNYLLVHYTHSSDNGTSGVIEGVNSAGFNQAILSQIGLPPLPLVPVALQPGCLYYDFQAQSSNCGQDIVAEQQGRDVRHVQLSANPNDVIKTGSVVDSLNYKLNEELMVRNIASYSTYKHHNRWDQDGSRAQQGDFVSPDDSFQSNLETYTEELQLQGKILDDRLKFAAGGYYEYSSPKGTPEQYTVSLFNPIHQEGASTHRSYGPFAQGTYELGGLSDNLEGLNLTAGARYTFDKADGYGAIDAGAGGSTSFKTKLSDSAPTWTVGLDYKLSKTLLYGKVSRGYKAGGISSLAANPEHQTFKPEFVTSYELGHKSDFKIGSVPTRVNSAVYYTDYTDLQRTAGDSYLADDAPPGTAPSFGGATFNAGKATIEGFETEVTILPFKGLSVSANYSYTHGKYDEFTLVTGTLTPQTDCSGQERARGETGDYSCAPFSFTPKNQYSVSASYQLPLDPGVGDVEASMTYAWVDKVNSAPISLPEYEPGAWLPSYGLLNGSLRWQNILGSSFDVQLYGTNLTDKVYRISNSNSWNLLYFQSSIYSEPRIVGLQIGYRWGS
jgi:iron complex outermembrane receptor protein